MTSNVGGSGLGIDAIVDIQGAGRTAPGLLRARQRGDQRRIAGGGGL